MTRSGSVTLLEGEAVRRYLLGDVLVIIAFLIIGEIHHGIDPLIAPLYVAETVAPFLIGWGVAAPLLGAYSSYSIDRGLIGAAMVLPGWIGTDVIGQLLRGTSLFHGGSGPIFAVVIGGGGAILLLLWRWLGTTFLWTEDSTL